MLLCCSQWVAAQQHRVYSPQIASLEVSVNDQWQSLPVMHLGTDDRLHIGFDELSHVYHRYTYRITHCEADWTTSEGLFESDYISGFNGDNVIEDCEESINTNQLYTHYRLQIPNDRISLKMSGNYRLDIIDDESEETVLSARFYVVEPSANVAYTVQVNTDIDVRKSHQQLDLQVDYASSLRVNDARNQFKVYAMQNGRMDNLVLCPPAPQIMQGRMIWTHCRDLIFAAGNEYHKYEFLDAHRNSLGVDRVEWDGEQYHVHLYPNEQRRSYVYDQDADGAFIIRNSDNYEADITSEYAMTHFYFESPELPGNVYVQGRWTTNSFESQSLDSDTPDSHYLMNYDPSIRCYTAAIPLKMGYYSWHYVFAPSAAQSSSTTRSSLLNCPGEGEFYETQNTYNVFVYYRSNLDRADRLVGFK